MKKIVAFAASAALALSAGAGLSTAANAAPGNGQSGKVAICQAATAGTEISVGNCVAFLNGNTNANSVCHFIQEVFPVFYATNFPNFGSCVSSINQVL